MAAKGFEYPSLSQALFVVAGFAALKFVWWLVWQLFPSKEAKKEVIEKEWKKDVVYLYQFNRTPFIPNVSPFCLKLETWLRAKNITYEIRPTTMGRSKYGLLPFVELNGEHIADSQLILLALQRQFGAQDVLSLEDASYARALDRLADGHTFYLLVKFKFDLAVEFITVILGDLPAFLRPLLAPVVAPIMKKRMMSRVHTALGNFSDVEFRNLLKADLDAYKHALGKKKFLFGDNVSLVLVDYLERVKRTVWGNEFTKN